MRIHQGPCPPSVPARGAASAKAVLRASAEVSEHRLRNGMRVIVAERHSDPVVAVLLFYRVGSRNDDGSRWLWPLRI